MGWPFFSRLLDLSRLSLIEPHATGNTSGDGDRSVRAVVSRRDLNQFVQLPWKIYANDPHWIPPLLIEVKEFLDPSKHPFYLHAEAARFLAFRQGEPVGRILVSDDPRYNEHSNENLGCFGLFECIEDPITAHALLDASADWLLERGRTRIRGPIDYSTNYPTGLLIDGFQTPPRYMMNHHRPYYAELLESWGLRKVKDLYAWWFEDELDLLSKWQRRADWLRERGRIVVRPFSIAHFERDVQRCHAVYNSARQHNWGAVGLTDAEFAYFAKRLRRVAVPELVLLAEVDDQPVGFAVTVPDVNEAIRPLNGRLTRFGLPIGLCRLLHRLPRTQAARMAVLVVDESYRRKGVAELLILATLEHGKSTMKFKGAELGWTLEDNDLINRAIERVGATRYKTYRVYEKAID